MARNEYLKKKTAANSFAREWDNDFDLTFVHGSTLVLQLDFCAKNPRPR